MEYTSAGLMEHYQDNLYKMRTELRIGLCLARFLREIDTTPSNIGTLKEDAHSSRSSLRVVGLQLDTYNNPVDLLADASIAMSAKHKFQAYNGSQANRLLAQYIKLSNDSDGDELIARVRAIEGNKELIIPIKPGTACTMEIDRAKSSTPYSDDKLEEKSKAPVIKSSKIEVVKWYTDRESGALKCYVITEALDAVTRTRGRCEITEYGKKFFLNDIENSTKPGMGSSKKEHRFIEMTHFGYIKPIKIENSMGDGFIVDNNYIYSFRNDSEPFPIAYWDNSNNLVGEADFEQAKKSSIYKELEKGLGLIAQHRRFIVPCYLADCNTVVTK